jgi:hypothetical protein
MLLDALRPPPGFDLDTALATTFTLDLDALFIPPAAWTLHAVESRVDDIDPILLANTLRRCAARIVVFCQAGCATQVKQKGRDELAAFVDEIVHPIAVDEHCTFHPKVWVLRFKSPAGERGLRVLIGSRNLTLDTSWDVLFRLDSDPVPDSGGIAAAPLADFFESLLTRTTVKVSDEQRGLVKSVGEDLRRTVLALPSGATNGEIRWWTRTDQYPELFPQACDRRLVISPFLGRGALDRLPPAPEEASILVSRPGSLSTPVVRGFQAYTLSTDAVGIDAGLEGRIDRDLHAKVFAFDHGETATLVVGSANATEAAFARNDELVVVLTGARDALGVGQLLGGEGDGDTGTSELSLRQLIQSWEVDAAQEADEEEATSKRFYEEAIRRVASVPLRGTCVATETSEFELTLCFADTVELVDGVDVELSLAGNRILPPDVFRRIPFSTRVDPSQATRFVQARFSDPSGKEEAVVVVLVADVNMPQGRHLKVLRSLLTDTERFSRFLRFLLEGTRDLGFSSGDGDGLRRRFRRRRGAALAIDDDVAILEQLLRLLAREPGELRHLKAVVREFADEDAMLPHAFRTIWKALEPLIPQEARSAVVG